MKILFQTVGTGGETNPVWEAMAYCVQQVKPDILFQLCSEQTRKETLPKFENSLRILGQSMPTREIDVCVDHDDVIDLSRHYSRIIAAELAKRKIGHSDDEELFIDFTSGTKAMSAALTVAAMPYRRAQWCYATGPRDANGRATRTDVLRQLSPLRIVAQNELAELGRIFNVGQYQAVGEMVKPLIQDLKSLGSDTPELQAKASTLRDLADIYDLWMRFEWKQACHKLQRLISPGKHGQDRLKLAGWDVDHLCRQKTFLEHCADRKLIPEYRMIDLLLNAKRCCDYGQYDDATARLYRLTEYLLQHRFAKYRPPCERSIPEWNPTKDVPAAFIKEHCPELLERKQNHPKQANYDLGLGGVLRVLLALKDPVGQQVGQQYGQPWLQDQTHGKPGPLHGALQARNNSWLAHGINPIGSKETKAMIQLLQEIVHYAANHAGYEPNNLDKMATFQSCPWIS